MAHYGAQYGIKMAATLVLGAIAMGSMAASAQAQSTEDWLATGEMVTHDTYLVAGEGISGWCDDDCTDLDLFLYDAASGELVSSDTMVDAVPSLVAPYDGAFFVEVVMSNCGYAPCAAWTDVNTHL
jgi:hypothetical protein